MSNKVPIYGASAFSPHSYEMPRKPPVIQGVDNQGKPTLKLETSKVIPNSTGLSSTVDISWLSSCSDLYQISPDIRDYVITVAPLITSDIPNRNMQGFALKTLCEFDPDIGRQRYKSWVAKPLHIEHKNSIKNKAIGVILDTSLVSVPKYKLAKMQMLMAFCRQKNPSIANEIANNGGSYSMGAMGGTFQCSVCGGVMGPGCKRTCTCYNAEWSDLATLGSIIDSKLQYLLVADPVGFETSYVHDPADWWAWGDIV